MDLLETTVIGYHSYEEYADSFVQNIKFRGKTLSEWEEEIELPSIGQDCDLHELKEANAIYIVVLKKVINNLAYAKTTLKACEMHYKSKINTVSNSIMDRWVQDNPGKRVMGADTLKSLATKECQSEYVALNIAESFVEFWQTQNEKLKLFDSRLSGIGYITALEDKHQHRLY